VENLDEYYNFNNIMQRMLSKVSDSIDKREGSIIYDALAPCAIEISQMYIVLKDNIDLSFVDTAVDEYLDRLSNQVGIERKPSTKSIRKAKFYDETENLMDIGIGERFTINDLKYKVIKRIDLGIYECECETEGTKGNTESGTLIPINYIEGLGKAVLTDILIPGEDAENDEELRERYFETINEKAFSGNIADYKKKTKEISGVGAVKVTPVWQGGGTVELTILDSNFNKASEQLIEIVQIEICPNKSQNGIGLAPIGHLVTVDTVEEETINISTNITLVENKKIEEIEEKIKSEINKYFLELKKTWEDSNSIIVRISQIETRILNIDEVLDISNTKINNISSNIEISSHKIPVIGTVEVVNENN